jgi:hypothetical protein
MSDATFTPGYKFNVGICLKEKCKNRDKKCKECIRFSEYKKEETK